jgi:hypothetical protein
MRRFCHSNCKCGSDLAIPREISRTGIVLPANQGCRKPGLHYYV